VAVRRRAPKFLVEALIRTILIYISAADCALNGQTHDGPDNVNESMCDDNIGAIVSHVIQMPNKGIFYMAFLCWPAPVFFNAELTFGGYE
jgi:hypothetical protein